MTDRARSRFVSSIHLLLLATLAIFAVPTLGRAAVSPDAKAVSIPGLCEDSFKAPKTLRGAVSDVAVTPVPLSSCTLNSNRDVVIGSAGCGPDVYVDKSLMGANGLGGITINADGQLAFLNNQSIQLDTAGILVNGKLEAGNATCQIGAKSPSTVVTINFTDTHAVAGLVKGIVVGSGGTLLLYGATGVAPIKTADPEAHAPSWTYLSQPAGPPGLYGVGRGIGSPVGIGGDTTLKLSGKVDWQPNQWIVVAGTDFAPDSAEFVRIASTSNCAATDSGECTVTLDAATPLIHYHFGSPKPSLGDAAFKDGSARNGGVDERAEVGLISRNVKLTATVTSAKPAWGGEIMIMSGFKEVAVRGVELEKFGKGQLGSYPLHFHKAGTVAAGTVLVNSDSIHHSYNKCVTIHDTNGVTVANMVCARAVGDLYFFETGTETGNTLQGNLGIGAMDNAFMTTPAGQSVFWDGDNLTNDPAAAWYNGYSGNNIPFTEADDGEHKVIGTATTPTGYWVTNPGSNTIVGNSVAGCQGTGRGFWILPANTSAAHTPLPLGNFDSNRAHGCYTGFDTASDDGVTGASSIYRKAPAKPAAVRARLMIATWSRTLRILPPRATATAASGAGELVRAG